MDHRTSQQSTGTPADQVVADLLERAREGRDQMMRSIESMQRLEDSGARSAQFLMERVRATLEQTRTDIAGSEAGVIGTVVAPDAVDARLLGLQEHVDAMAARLELAQLAVERMVEETARRVSQHLTPPVPPPTDAAPPEPPG